MPERDRIVDQLKRAFEGGAWHGPSVMEALEGVDAKRAFGKPIPAAHSIWEIVLHIAVWEDAVRRRLLGEMADPAGEEDWPPVTDRGEAAWARALESLRAGHMRLREVAGGVRDEDLDRSPGGKYSTRYVLLHGAIQHDLYHAGQISLLRKA